MSLSGAAGAWAQESANAKSFTGMVIDHTQQEEIWDAKNSSFVMSAPDAYSMNEASSHTSSERA